MRPKLEDGTKVKCLDGTTGVVQYRVVEGATSWYGVRRADGRLYEWCWLHLEPLP